MDPNEPKRIKVKSTATCTEKGKQTTSSSFQPPKRPRSVPSSAPSVPQQAPQLRNDLQKFRYDLFQGSKYNYCLHVEWSAYANENFYIEVKKFIENMSWLDLANLSEKCYSFVHVIIESNLGKLLGCKHYGDFYEAHNHYPSNNVWNTLARKPGCKKMHQI